MSTYANCFRHASQALLSAVLAMFCAGVMPALKAEVLPVQAAGFQLATNCQAGPVELVLDTSNTVLPFCQSAVKQSVAPARQGPDPARPYFAVRFALPVPPENDTNLAGALVGLDSKILAHNHSPGFEILPNGDALAVWFSAKNSRGASENSNSTCFVQARLRHGAEQWDLPELFCDFEGANDQSGLLWNDGGTVRFFGGGRDGTPWLPFKMAASTDNGATWTLSLPQLAQPAEDFTPQPINSAFRGSDRAMYFAMDAAKDQSFLWRSADEGVHWRQLAGHTGARHSTMVPLNDQGWLLSFGGKNYCIDGWTPQNISTNLGADWQAATASPFPALGGNQRPSLIRLANGHLFYASDSYIKKSGKFPPAWKLGAGAFVAVSTNNGADWQFKNLPVLLPHHEDRNFGTLGYATARQAPNGVIHVLATMTQPCLHYEFNEAWVFSAAGDLMPESSGGEVKAYAENFPNGKVRSQWGARICPDGRYLLHGPETDFYVTGKKQHEVTYENGRKTGTETFWATDGKKLWCWAHDLPQHHSVWTQFWPDGRKKVESNWNTEPVARDLPRHFSGFVADGPSFQWAETGGPARTAFFTNGCLAGDLTEAKGTAR